MFMKLHTLYNCHTHFAHYKRSTLQCLCSLHVINYVLLLMKNRTLINLTLIITSIIKDAFVSVDNVRRETSCMTAKGNDNDNNNEYFY